MNQPEPNQSERFHEAFMKFRDKTIGATLFGHSIEKLDRDSLIAALGWALTALDQCREEINRATESNT